MKNLIKVTILIFIIAFISCQEPNGTHYKRDATLIWTGEYEVGGCGFFVEVDSIRYKPESESVISPHFKKKSATSITLQYLNLYYKTEYFCGDSPNAQKIDIIKIISIDENKLN